MYLEATLQSLSRCLLTVDGHLSFWESLMILYFCGRIQFPLLTVFRALSYSLMIPGAFSLKLRTTKDLKPQSVMWFFNCIGAYSRSRRSISLACSSLRFRNGSLQSMFTSSRPSRFGTVDSQHGRLWISTSGIKFYKKTAKRDTMPKERKPNY